MSYQPLRFKGTTVASLVIELSQIEVFYLRKEGRMTKPMKQSHVTVATASLIGTAIEWYDYFLYGTAAALVFNKLFFPKFDPMIGTIMAFATFAIGFIARPIGGMVFGHFGDRIGRKTMLYLTFLIMGVATALIGILPTYESVGIWAPILLVVMRICQGFGLGESGAELSLWPWNTLLPIGVVFMEVGRSWVHAWDWSLQRSFL